MIPQLGEDETEILEQVHLTLSMSFKLNFLPTILAWSRKTNKQSIFNLVIDQWPPTPSLGYSASTAAANYERL